MANNDKEKRLLQRALIRQAQAAADINDAMLMYKNILSSTLLEGYERQFSNRYQNISCDDVHDTIGDALDELYRRVNKGERIMKVESYLWKVTDRMLTDLVAKRRLFSNKSIELFGSNDASPSPENLLDEKEQYDKIRSENLFSMVESLIPKIGGENVQAVMRYIIVAYKNGAQHITNGEIADALGWDEKEIKNVKVWKARGFERLAARLKEGNIIERSHAFPFLEEIELYVGDEESDQYDIDNSFDE